MFRRLLIGGRGIYFAGVALVLVFPRQLVRHRSPGALLPFSLLLIAATVLYDFPRVSTRRRVRMKAVVVTSALVFRGGTGRYSRRQLKENDPDALGEDVS
jgi:hypothetical protein